MAGARILIKVAGDRGVEGRELSLGAAAGSVRLRRLFAAPAGGAGAALAPAAPHTWYVAEGSGPQALASDASPWDAAHGALRGNLGLAAQQVIAAEPDLQQSWPLPRSEEGTFGLAAEDRCTPTGQNNRPPLEAGPGFGWHLDDAFSGLRTARTRVGVGGEAITIVHLDTGYDENHRGLPPNLAESVLHRNFVEGGTSAVDATPASGLLTNRGHGTGTIGILAGGRADGRLSSGLEIPSGFGEIGGAPRARIVPVRVADSVVHFWTSTVAQGIDYAREIRADVLSMSMGGLPSAAWADAVNAAYEAGVVLVCAAGNSFRGLPTSLIVYPARFDRVIAACGVMAGAHAYHELGGPMEGNVGPAHKMRTAMAAYTPNIPWLRIGCPTAVDMDGAGTSSATPQIAAAAALWLAEHGGGYERSWKRVEAVRAALFGSARRPGGGAATPDALLGRGILRAADALDIEPAVQDLRLTGPDSASFAFLRLLTSIFGVSGPDPRQLDMFRVEITQLALSSRPARDAIPDPDIDPAQLPASHQRRFIEAIREDQNCSNALRGHLDQLLGRAATPRGTQPPSAPTTGSADEEWGTGADIRRPARVPVPSRRRLQIFATDPGDSAHLATSFVNITTVDVPWEPLRKGPVGEYLEVVDVDPASDAAYDPVDLDNPHLLAQDGLGPSEGNPQFHQQMVYAVAMRTIRNFEIALGRRALWAERHMQPQDGRFVPAPDDGYVQRLRIYPHALRERNAYYSPEKKALLFGYFGEQGPSQGRRTIFTCLSHDIVAHETTHALLDGLHRRFQEPTNEDVLAFHEAFADLVAIFQHFTFPELLRYEITQLRGGLGNASMLSDLARQFGESLHNGRALRQAISADTDGKSPGRPVSYAETDEPHERGAILVAAVFEAFVAIYRRRTDDLYQIATGGTGVLAPGAIHPDLVARLSEAAVEVAQRILTLCIRALDYMPPVDPSFGDYLRALVTADADLAADGGLGYRVALAEAFTKRGIYPRDITNVAPDSLLWRPPDESAQPAGLSAFLRDLDLGSYTQSNRQRAFRSAKVNAARLHGWLAEHVDARTARDLGLDFRTQPDGKPLPFEVHSVRPARRTTADGESRTDIVAVITQRRKVPVVPGRSGPSFTFRGGCTLLLDLEYDSSPIRYAIARPVWNSTREERVRQFRNKGTLGPDALYTTADVMSAREPFAMLHSSLPGGLTDGQTDR